MMFTSASFLLFFMAVWAAWYALPLYRMRVLFLASAIFIVSFSWISLLICLLLSAVNFKGAQKLSPVRRRLLYLSIQLLNVVSIPVAGWISGQSLSFSSGMDAVPTLLVVLGLSFYSLQHFSYLEDVYKKRLDPEQEWLPFLTASMYFPKFISGPVVRYPEIRLQFDRQVQAEVSVAPSLKRILVGYFKKMVIADALAPSVSSVFDHMDPLPGITIIAAAVLFTFQLYFDFSGYSDIAIGCSRLLGIRLPENFDFPLRAAGMTEFWRRWHITLLRFFTDHLFLPFTYRYRRLGKVTAVFGIVLVFVASALWHGLGITFLLWGGCHVIYMLTEYLIKLPAVWNRPVFHPLRCAITVLLFSLSNVFFRSPDWGTCRHLVGEIFREGNFIPANWSVDFIAPLAVGGHQADLFNFYLLLAITGIFILIERRIFRKAQEESWAPVPAFLILLMIFLLGVFSSAHRFIYMQF